MTDNLLIGLLIIAHFAIYGVILSSILKQSKKV